MIITTLSGGLGNQMFMYAMVRAMALRNNTEMAFDIHTGFEEDFQFRRLLELDYLNTKIPTVRKEAFDLGPSVLSRAVKKISRRFRRNILCPSYSVISEGMNGGSFLPDVYKTNKTNVYLEGYWQTLQYFDDFKDVIKDDFKIIAPISDCVTDELARLRRYERPLVMVGVRRYQECTISNYQTENVCSADYYKRAIDLMRLKLTNPIFVLFSQDQDWLKKNFKDSDFVMALPKSGQYASIEDLYLMTNCDHAIISNSSYFWWGAWLQEDVSNHLVISPNNFINKDTPCSNWIIIDAK